MIEHQDSGKNFQAEKAATGWSIGKFMHFTQPSSIKQHGMYYRLWCKKKMLVERKNKPYSDCRIESLFLYTPLTILFVYHRLELHGSVSACYLFGSLGPSIKLAVHKGKGSNSERGTQAFTMRDFVIWNMV